MIKDNEHSTILGIVGSATNQAPYFGDLKTKGVSSESKMRNHENEKRDLSQTKQFIS